MMAVIPEPALDEDNEDNVEEVVDLNAEPELERVIKTRHCGSSHPVMSLKMNTTNF